MELGSGESSQGGIALRETPEVAMTKTKKSIANERNEKRKEQERGERMTARITVPCIRVKQIHSKRNLADTSSAVQDPGIGSSQLPEIDCFRATNGDTAPASLHVHMVLYLWLWCCYHVVTTFISPTRYELFVILSAMTGLVVSSYPSLRYHENDEEDEMRKEADRRARKRTGACCFRARNRTHAQPSPCFQK
ncbi:uncharacterized protein LOC105259083 isoform X2 [Camponotus floridanus]|uniref:uncharacterized protein LOC105259083 isoform X2 n=1 Tax=Camponotus floridanus TaxID=104421 RepID=UPI00059B7839|nr:uncharacterized protein LOC105259083 isoform X2 [Camponotus floridanus]